MPDFGRKDYNDNYEALVSVSHQTGHAVVDGALEMIPADEPVLLLRASDAIAMDIISGVMNAYLARYDYDMANPTVQSVIAHYNKFKVWQTADDTSQLVKLGDVPS